VIDGQRVVAARCPALLSSPVLGGVEVPHFFSTREAGDLAPVARAEAFVALRWAGRKLVRCQQVHGDAVAVVRSDTIDVPEADALVTADPGVIVAVRTADCVPILLCTDDGGVVAAVHAGWRGVVAGVLPRAIAAMRSLSERPLLAAVGPCISGAAFEVGPEVVAEFRRCFGALADGFIASALGDRSHIDLVEAVVLQMPGVRIDVAAAQCTYRGAQHFFSHRREPGNAGRMLAGIGCRAPN